MVCGIICIFLLLFFQGLEEGIATALWADCRLCSLALWKQPQQATALRKGECNNFGSFQRRDRSVWKNLLFTVWMKKTGILTSSVTWVCFFSFIWFNHLYLKGSARKWNEMDVKVLTCRGDTPWIVVLSPLPTSLVCHRHEADTVLSTSGSLPSTFRIHLRCPLKPLKLHCPPWWHESPTTLSTCKMMSQNWEELSL